MVLAHDGWMDEGQYTRAKPLIAIRWARMIAVPRDRAAAGFCGRKAWQSGAWRSLVAQLLWEQWVGGSNPSAPTSRISG